MTEAQNKKKKNIKVWLILIAILLVVAVFIGWRVWQNRQNMEPVLANIETEPYQRRTLNTNIYGTGTVEPVQTAVLTWSAGGVVGDVLVAVGDQVVEDQLLMSLDPDSLSVDILQAEIDLINTQNALDDLYDNWQSDLAQTRLDLLNAQEALEDLENERKIMNYQRCTDERIEELEDELDQAEQIYKFRQNSDTLRAVNTAQANLDYCLADFTEREIAEAELEVELAEARVAKLQERVNLLEDGPDPDQVTILETQLSMAQSRLDSPLIKAPFDGVVTVVKAKRGDVVQPGMQAVQIDNLSELFIDVKISEVDIPFVQIDQPAQLVFDAYFENTFEGEVVEISPVGNVIQGVVEYDIRIKMQNADDRIKPGMSAAVNIVVDEKEDVFVVPNDAIVSIDGQDNVYVQRNGSYEAVKITLGSYSDFYSEVIEADIKEGELIVLNPPEEITGEMPFGGPPQGGFGGFGN
ncbi:MAG: efflux RND transporter periplasmic adaptor subunit [Chloroflexota bacterium]|nr:efflux RND transporter periplasmic adaptor subunit [Chloroflexota bacterium]